MKNNIPEELYNASGIYEIRNLANGKVYIGSTIYMFRRFRQHQRDLKKNKHYNSFLQASFNKYGEGSFVFSVRCSLDITKEESRRNIGLRLMEAENEAMISSRSIDRKFGYNIDSFERSNRNNLACRNLDMYKRGERHSKTILTNELVLFIAKLFKEGQTVGYISRQLSVSRQIVYTVVTGLSWSSVTGITLGSLGGMPKGEKAAGAKLDNQTVLMVVNLIQAGGSNKAISKELAISYAAVKGIRAGGIYASISGFDKIIGRKKGRQNAFTEEQVLEVRQLLGQGISCRKIAQKLKVSHSTISYIKRGKGVYFKK